MQSKHDAVKRLHERGKGMIATAAAATSARKSEGKGVCSNKVSSQSAMHRVSAARTLRKQHLDAATDKLAESAIDHAGACPSATVKHLALVSIG